MTDVRNIVVVGGLNDNQAKLETVLQPVKTEQEMGMAITSIFHGNINNITEQNNRVYYNTDIDFPDVIEYIEIQLGYYQDVGSIMKEIANKFREKFRNKIGTPRFQFGLNKQNVISITLTDLTILANNKSPWDLMDIATPILPNLLPSVTLQNATFLESIEPAFLYVSIIENSYINGKLSRLLTVVPLANKKGWNFYEFYSPNYIPIAVREFSKIDLEIRDINGRYVPFNSKYNTTITLSIKPINTPE